MRVVQNIDPSYDLIEAGATNLNEALLSVFDNNDFPDVNLTKLFIDSGANNFDDVLEEAMDALNIQLLVNYTSVAAIDKFFDDDVFEPEIIELLAQNASPEGLNQSLKIILGQEREGLGKQEILANIIIDAGINGALVAAISAKNYLVIDKGPDDFSNALLVAIEADDPISVRMLIAEGALTLIKSLDNEYYTQNFNQG